MSVMECDTSRRYLPQSLAFTNFYYNERNAPLALSHTTRTNPRGYPFGGPVSGLHSGASMGREEFPMDAGPARRRIAVACARCRKRKIRCSGDPGNDTGCTNCKHAGIDPTQCLFHRVGSDHVHKVMDNYNMAQSLTSIANANGMLPIYSANNAMNARPFSAQQYPQLDTKPVYHSNWAVPYSEETSPVDPYNLSQQTTYLPNPAPMTNTNMYAPSWRWTHPVPKSLHHGTSGYFDQESSYTTHGLPYIQTETNLRAATTEALSPLNMSSLQLTLPERPHPRQLRISEAIAPKRELPIPQPSPALTSRNVVDQLQDQRLRSAQALGASNINASSSFLRPLLPWNANGDNPIILSKATRPHSSAQTTTQVPSTTDGTLGYIPTTASINNAINTASATPQFELNFSTSTLLGAINAPAPTTPYSNFRGTPRLPIARPASETNLYSFSSDHTLKRNSRGGELPNDCTLVSGHRYTPLHAPQPQSTSRIGSLRRESFENRNVPLHCASMPNSNSSF